jgi:hypothetical protein
MTTLDEFFSGNETSLEIYRNLFAVIDVLGPVEVSITKSQIAFRRRKAFAWAWIPGKYLHGKTAPLVLSVALGRKASSLRWKQVVEPKTGRFMHHLELYDSEQIDNEVRAWLQEAWDVAG